MIAPVGLAVGIVLPHLPLPVVSMQQSPIAQRAILRLLLLHTHRSPATDARSTPEPASAGQGGFRPPAPRTRPNSQHLTNKHLKPAKTPIPFKTSVVITVRKPTEVPVAITRHGDTIGYYIPARRKRSEAERTALKEAAIRLQQALAAEGISEEEILNDFKQWRAGGRK
jgi:PHD/YefM family antitoxin component YafN of YafNO toxin-antitoxin module